MVAHLDAMTARLRTGEPLQYVLGEWSFRRITLAVDRRVLIPRPETELVADVASAKASEVGPTRVVADLGTGSGAIGLSLAHELPLDGTTVWITDADVDALDVARANIAGLGRAGVNVRVAHGSWFDALPDDLHFDVIVSNPPYVAADSPDLEAIVGDWEPHAALFAGPDGLDDIRRIIADAPARLRSGGWLVLEIGADQGDAVAGPVRCVRLPGRGGATRPRRPRPHRARPPPLSGRGASGPVAEEIRATHVGSASLIRSRRVGGSRRRNPITRRRTMSQYLLSVWHEEHLRGRLREPREPATVRAGRRRSTTRCWRPASGCSPAGCSRPSRPPWSAPPTGTSR